MLPGDREVGEYLVSHPGVDKVSFTGSTAAGRQVAAACGANLKRVSLELGGKSAAVVLDDADPAAVAAGIEIAGLMNSGQACVAQTRVLVPRSRYDEFVDALGVDGRVVARWETRPTPRREYRAAGGPSPAGPGSWLHRAGPERRRPPRRRRHRPPGRRRPRAGTSARRCSPTSTTTCASRRKRSSARSSRVIPYTDDADAVRIADDSDYGLSGSVWTADVDRGLAVARRVRTGTFGVNQPYAMDPNAPFGGMKASGIGRELGREGIEGFLDVKSISVAAAT